MATSTGLQHNLLSLAAVATQWDDAIELVIRFSDYRSAILKFEQLLKSLSIRTTTARAESSSQEEFAQLTDPKLLAKLWFNIGAIYSPLGDSPLAIDAFKSSTLLDEESAVTWYAIGIEQYRSRDFKAAYAAFDRSKSIIDPRKDTRIRVDLYETIKNSPIDPFTSSPDIMKKKWNFRKSMAEANLKCTVAALKNPKAGKEILDDPLLTIPMGVLHGPPNMDTLRKGSPRPQGARAEEVVRVRDQIAATVYDRHIEVKGLLNDAHLLTQKLIHSEKVEGKKKDAQLTHKADRQDEVQGKMKDARRLRTELDEALAAERRAKLGVGRSMSEGAGSRSKPLPKLPHDATEQHARAFKSSDNDPDLNPSSVYTSLHTSAKLVSPYDSHSVKKEIEEDSAGLPDHSQRHTTPHELKVRIPRSASSKGQESPRFKPSPSTATTSNTFGSPVFSAKASPLTNATFTFTPPTQGYSDGPPTSIKTSFNLSPPKGSSLSRSPPKVSSSPKVSSPPKTSSSPKVSSPPKAFSPPSQSPVGPFRGLKAPYLDPNSKNVIREHSPPQGPGQWLWQPKICPLEVTYTTAGLWQLAPHHNRNYEMIPYLPPHLNQPGEWIWKPDDPFEPEPVRPNLPLHLLKPGEWQPHNPSKARGDMLFTLDLDSIEEENAREAEAIHHSKPESHRANQGSSLLKSQSARIKHGSPRMKDASPLRQVFSVNDRSTDEEEEQSAFIPLNFKKAQADTLAQIWEEEPDSSPKPKPKSKKRSTVGAFDGSWPGRVAPENLARCSVSIDVPCADEDKAKAEVGQRWQDQLIDDPLTHLGDDLPTNQGIGLGIEDGSSPLFADLMRDLTESNGGRQVVEEAYNALTSGASTSATSTPRMRGGFAKKPMNHMTPRTRHEESLYDLTPKLFQGPGDTDEYRSSKSTKTIQSPTFPHIDYKHQSFLPTFELKPTVFEGFQAYKAASKPTAAAAAQPVSPPPEIASPPAVSAPTETSTPKAATTPTISTTPKAPSTPKAAAAAAAAPKTPRTPKAPQTPRRTSPSPPSSSSSSSSPAAAAAAAAAAAEAEEGTISPLDGSPKKATAYDSDAAAESDDTVRNVRLRRRSRQGSPPSYKGFALKHVPNKQFAVKPENAAFIARERKASKEEEE